MAKSQTKKAVLFTIGFFLFTVLLLISALMLNLLSNALETRREGVLSGEKDAVLQNAVPVFLIDAGHGGADGGAVGFSGSLEKDLNLCVALRLGALLDAVGCEVKYTRTDDIMLEGDEGSTPKVRDIRKRVSMANELNGCLISIHMNTYPASKYKGLQVFYADNNTDSDIMAKKLQEYVRTNLQNDNTREAKPSPVAVYLTKHITCPGIICECGFISNPEEDALLSSDEYRNTLAAVLCCGILQ